jgi:hypothetical protein
MTAHDVRASTSYGCRNQRPTSWRAVCAAPRALTRRRWAEGKTGQAHGFGCGTPRRAPCSPASSGRAGRLYPGIVGADLKNLVNEAALLAASRGESQVTMADFSNSLEKIVLGTVRGIVLSSEERERTAFHESGYALLGMLTPGADPVRKISITPADRSSASPTSRHRPTATATPRNISAAGSPARWAGTGGGGRVRGGDHRRRERPGARQQHRPADRGPLGHVTSDRAGLGAPPPGEESPYGLDGVAQATEELVDTEARKIIEECCGQALATLRGSRDRLDRLARAPGTGNAGPGRRLRRRGHRPGNRSRRDRTRRGAQHPPAPPQRRACLPRPHNQVQTGSRLPRAHETR